MKNQVFWTIFVVLMTFAVAFFAARAFGEETTQQEKLRGEITENLKQDIVERVNEVKSAQADVGDQWSMSRSDDPMDGSYRLWLSNDAIEYEVRNTNKRHAPILQIYCSMPKRTVSLSVFWNTIFANDLHKGRIKIDDLPIIEKYFRADSEMRHSSIALGWVSMGLAGGRTRYPDKMLGPKNRKAKGRDLVAYLAQAETLIISAENYQERENWAKFDLTGLAHAGAELFEKCGVATDARSKRAIAGIL